MNFENSALVATCAFLLELFGLSTIMLRVDISALQRISSYYKTMRNSVHFNHVIPINSTFHSFSQEGDPTASLARALADNYQRLADLGILQHKDSSVPAESSKQPPRTLVSVLQHLEKASLPSLDEGKTCGSWLKNGSGDGTEFRSQQEVDSKHWSLVTEFCRIHHLPLSTKYLALLAKDNDWVILFLSFSFSGQVKFISLILILLASCRLDFLLKHSLEDFQLTQSSKW